MKESHRSALKIECTGEADVVLSLLSPGAVKLLLALARWSALWNYAGAIPEDVALSVTRNAVPSDRTFRKLIRELQAPACSSCPPAVTVQNGVIQIDHRIISFTRDGVDWDRNQAAGVIESDGSRCRYCGTECFEDLTIDHVFPRSRGGSDNPSNLVVACRSCNSRKSDKTPEEAGMRLLPARKVRA